LDNKLPKPFEGRMLPELAGGLDLYEMAFKGQREITAGNLQEIRDSVNGLFEMVLASLPANERVEISDHVAPGLHGAPPVPLRVYRPKGASGPLPCLYWIHGGGMIMAKMHFDDPDCQAYAENVNCVVVSVEYRLAPESAQPALIEDCYAGLKWVAENADRLGIAADRIAVGGRSGGGCLAAATTLMARDIGAFPIAFQLLIYPMLDDAGETASAREFADVISWGAGHNRFAWSAVLGTGAARTTSSPYAVPARVEDLSRLPPTYVQVGGLEIFRDEAIAYAQRLMMAGTQCELQVYPGQYHASDMFNPMAESIRRMAMDRFAVPRRALVPGEAEGS